MPNKYDYRPGKENVSCTTCISNQMPSMFFATDVPVEIAYGKIGKLQLVLPWSSVLKWQSSTSANVECSVILSDLCILITPKMTRRRKRTVNRTSCILHVKSNESKRKSRYNACWMLNSLNDLPNPIMWGK